MSGKSLSASNLSYKVREHPRAKSVRFRVTPQDGLVITVPPGFNRRLLPEMIKGQLEWIQGAMGRMKERLAERDTCAENELPTRMDLLAVKEKWAIKWVSAPTPRRLIMRAEEGLLTLTGDLSRPAFCHAALRRWILRKAEVHLVPWLREVSQEVNLPFGHVTIRTQKTRWGSCTAKHNLSINSKLLFFPPALVRHVFLHELSHTLHLNHSKEFWGQVAANDPACAQRTRDLRKASRHVPTWMDAR